MKTPVRLACLLVLVAGAAHAAAPDGPDAQTAPTLAAAPPAPSLAAALVEPHRQALTTLHGERQAFVQAFDWTAGDRVARGREFQLAMDAFDLRELELKRDWYAASGQADLLARVEEALAAKTAPVRVLPEIVTGRPAVPVPQTEEAGQ